ncbi:MAG TPA: hypothetical protein VGH87_07745, partial [Polyangiaceae bacterium]
MSERMTIRYIIERIDGGYRATCEEQGASAIGATVDTAVSSLRRALEEIKQAESAKRGAA